MAISWVVHFVILLFQTVQLSEIVTDTLDKTAERFWGIEIIGIEENQSVYNHFCVEISFNEIDNRFKV